MLRLLDPHTTVAVILGAQDWTRAGQTRAPSFRRSAGRWAAYLIEQHPRGLGLEPDLVLNLFDDPSSANDQLLRIRDTIGDIVRERRDTSQSIRDVLIYYIGHGTCESGRHLHLLVRNSSKGMEEQSSIATPALAHVLRLSAPQQRRLVILDCCFSEAAAEAFGAMSSLDEAVAATALRDLAPKETPSRGTLLLCSSPRGSVSIGLPNAEQTLFTGALLRVLREGSALRHSEMLSFADLQDDIYDRMLLEYRGEPPRPALHQPDQVAGDLTRLPAFPNVAVCVHHIEPGIQQNRKLESEEATRRAKERREAIREQAEREAARKAEEQAEARRKAAQKAATRRAKERREAIREQAEREAARKAEEQAEARRKAAQKAATRRAKERREAIREQAEREAARKAEEQAEARRKAEQKAAASLASLDLPWKKAEQKIDFPRFSPTLRSLVPPKEAEQKTDSSPFSSSLSTLLSRKEAEQKIDFPRFSPTLRSLVPPKEAEQKTDSSPFSSSLSTLLSRKEAEQKTGRFIFGSLDLSPKAEKQAEATGKESEPGAADFFSLLKPPPRR